MLTLLTKKRKSGNATNVSVQRNKIYPLNNINSEIYLRRNSGDKACSRYVNIGV